MASLQPLTPRHRVPARLVRLFGRDRADSRTARLIEGAKALLRQDLTHPPRGAAHCLAGHANDIVPDMPIPLLVPILLGGGSLILGGLGIKKGKDGVDAMRDAKRIGKAAERRHRAQVRLVESARDHLRQRIDGYAEQQREVVRVSFGRLFDCLERMDQRARMQALEAIGEVEVTPEVVDGFKAQYLEAGGTAKGVFAALGSGAGAAGATTAAVSAFGTASTGAAISGLSGAAAKSALLAWLGGGSLAAGGGGMALGSLVLGGIVIGPTLAVTGFVLADQGEKARTKAKAYAGEVNTSVEKLKLLIAFSHRVEARVDELSELVTRLDARLNDSLGALESIVTSFDVESEQHIARFSKTMALAKGISEIIRAPVLDDAGKLNDETATLLERFRPLTAEDA